MILQKSLHQFDPGQDLMNIEMLKAQEEILMSLPYMTAYTGSLNELHTGSYVKFSEVTARLAEIRKKIREFK